MSSSILTSTKKILGLDADYTAFDPDVIMHINTVFSTLNQLGVGAPEGFSIEDDTATWETYLIDTVMLNLVKQYVYLKVRIVFDPPQTSYLIESMNKQIEQLEWRISVMREDVSWVDPNPPVITYDSYW